MSAELPDDERPGTNSSVSFEKQNVANFYFKLGVECLAKWSGILEKYELNL